MAVLIQSFQDKSSHYIQDTVIDGVAVTITLDFNTRSGYWTFSITDGTNTLLHKKLVGSWPILRQSRASFPNLPGDFILLISDLDVVGDVNYDNLNNGWTFLYLDQEELQAWEDANGIR